MINTEQTARIACCFIASFYKRFVEDLPSLASFYSEQSSTSFARVDEAVATTSQGKDQVLQYLVRLNEDLGPRKVEVRTADFVPTTDGSVAITVTGTIFTKRLRQAFTQTFVLAPTKFKDNTLFISADSLRFVSKEKEVLPANSIIVAAGEELTLNVVHAKAPEAERKERPPRERKERQPRAEEASKEAAPKEAAPVAAQEKRPVRERRERKPREAKPLVDTPAAPVAPVVAPAAPVAQKKEFTERQERKPRVAKEELAPAAPAVPASKPSWAGLVSGKTVPVEAPKPVVAAKPSVPSASAEKKFTDKPARPATTAAPVEKREAAPKAAPKAAAAPAAAPAASVAAPAAAAAPSPKESAPLRERTLTSKVKIVKVPKEILLSEVRAAVSKYGKVVDAFWRGEDDAIVVLNTPEEARAFQSDRDFVIKDIKLRRFYCFEN
jgi:hypothetical protein